MISSDSLLAIRNENPATIDTDRDTVDVGLRHY